MKRTALKRDTPKSVERGAKRGYGRKICVIDGCGGAHVARGWCVMHYQRWRLHGDPEHVPDEGEPPVLFVCPGCGKDCERFASQIRHRGGGEFCSSSCRARMRASARTRRCQMCDKTFTPVKATTRVTGKFCSRQCYRRWVDAQPRKQITRICPTCGDKFTRPAAWGKSKYCSRPCHAAGRVRVESEHSRGSGWRALAERIRDRDARVCVRCERPEQKRKHPVDHIVPWVLCKMQPQRANDPNNLATLCMRCHGQKTTLIEPRLLRGDWLALREFYGVDRAAAAMAVALVDIDLNL